MFSTFTHAFDTPNSYLEGVRWENLKKRWEQHTGISFDLQKNADDSHTKKTEWFEKMFWFVEIETNQNSSVRWLQV